LHWQSDRLKNLLVSSEEGEKAGLFNLSISFRCAACELIPLLLLWGRKISTKPENAALSILFYF
jgi:hypothetical protein